LNNEAAIGLGIFVLLVLILFLLHGSHQRREQNDIRKALIEKFGSAQDLGSFLQSEGGKRFIADLSTGTAGALGSVLASVQKGIILLLLGFGCAAAHVFTSLVVLGIGLVFMCVGAGFLVSAGVTYWLSKSWGLLGKRSDS
jgi:hypothetical protein